MVGSSNFPRTICPSVGYKKVRGLRKSGRAAPSAITPSDKAADRHAHLSVGPGAYSKPQKRAGRTASVQRPPLALLFVLLLTGTLVAGCTGGTDDGETTTTSTTTPTVGTPTDDGTEKRWTNPYDFTLRFDGQRAYDDVLWQIYTDPENRTGDRYRIPGTPETAEVAAWLRDNLEAALAPIGGTAEESRFDGTTYYELDHGPDTVARNTCKPGDERRERVKEITFINVIGRTHPDQVGLIIGAHYDSKLTASQDPDRTQRDEPILGADDGASGTAAVLNLARALAHDPPDIPLTFILFDGEDGFEDCHPLAGSLYHAQRGIPETERDSVLGMVLLDMVGNASAEFRQLRNTISYVTSDGDSVSSAWLTHHIWDTAAAMGVKAFKDQTTSPIIDDHIPYLEQGWSATDIIRFEGAFPPYWHTTRDDHTAVSPVGLEQVGVVVEAAVRLYADEQA